MREVLGLTEFRAVLASSALSVLGDQVARVAVAVIVYDRTGSAFAAAATVACSYLTWLVGGPFLSVLADRLPRRRLMVACDLVRAVLVGLLVLPGVPLWALFAVLLLVGALAPPFDSAKSALLPEILVGDRYLVGNAVVGTLNQGGQAAGFLLGGALVAVVSPEGALAIDALTFVLSAAVLRAWVRERPQPERPRQSVARDAVEGAALVGRSAPLRRLLAFGAVGSIVMITPESLAVPVADVLGGGAVTVGWLIAAGPLGFLVGAWAVLRLPAERRDGWLTGLTVLSCAPLLLSPLVDSAAVLVVVWTVAGTGAAAQLIANAGFMAAVAPGARGRAFGIAMVTIMATQGLGALAVGAVAEVLDPRSAVALSGAVALVLLVPVALLPRHVAASPLVVVTAREQTAPQAVAESCRSTSG